MIPRLIMVNFTLTRYFFKNLFLNLKPSVIAFKTVFIYKMIMVGLDTLLFYGSLNVKKRLEHLGLIQRVSEAATRGVLQKRRS